MGEAYLKPARGGATPAFWHVVAFLSILLLALWIRPIPVDADAALQGYLQIVTGLLAFVFSAVTLVRFQGGDPGVLSGLMRGADQIRNRPAIVDAPVGKGRVIYYVNNPIYRWQTFGEYQLVFNALLYFKADVWG